MWAGAETGGKLESLAKDVIGALSGYGADERFTAHLTIARVKRKLDLKPFLEKHNGESFGRFDVKVFRLMQSELGPSGPKYSVLAEFPAGQSDA